MNAILEAKIQSLYRRYQERGTILNDTIEWQLEEALEIIGLLRCEIYKLESRSVIKDDTRA